MSTDTNVSIVALLVGLSALICSTAQLLCQYLATADGYRRCQKPVMGPWAKETRLRWRWRQFRFETIFSVPEIILWDGLIKESSECLKTELITGSKFSRDRTHASPASLDTPHIYEVKSSKSRDKKPVFTEVLAQSLDLQSELVCWLGMLEALHEHESDVERLGLYKCPLPNPEQTRPAIIFRRRSWDSMSPDSIRPHAVSNLFDVAVLVQRLGMIWQDFRESTSQAHCLIMQLRSGHSVWRA